MAEEKSAPKKEKAPKINDLNTKLSFLVFSTLIGEKTDLIFSDSYLHFLTKYLKIVIKKLTFRLNFHNYI